MNSVKILFVITLLMLAKSAWGIEVEPNNDSAHANPLGIENVGQLSQGSDVDFFSIVNSCITYTADDQKSDSSHIAGTCAKYTANDLTTVPPQKIGDIKYRSEISLAFSCDSRAATTTTGWYLGLLDSNGILQNTYQVQPKDCMVGASGSQGPYSFKFSTLSGNNTLKPDAKYYLSVVADCHLPVYTIPQNSNPVISVNTFVQSTPASQTDIDAAKAEIATAQLALTTAQNTLANAYAGQLTDASGNILVDALGNNVNFSIINSNANIAQASDALLAAKDIANKADADLKTGITTAVTTINTVISTAKAVEIMSSSTLYSIQTHTLFLLADSADKAAANDVNLAADTLKTVTNTLPKNQDNIDAATANKQALVDIKTIKDAARTAADTDDTNATIQLNKANAALSDAVTALNATVTADIAAENAATNSGSRTNNACAVSNTATYTIKDNQDNSPKITPYLDIAAKNPPALGLQSSQQTSSAYDVDFFTVNGNPLTEIPLEFSCTKNSAKGSTEGWVVSAWTNDSDKPEFAYQISPKDCDPANPYPLKLPKYSGNYYIGIQSSCALAPTDKSNPIQLIYYDTTNNPTTVSSNFLCIPNTASFTIKQGEIANVLDLSNLTTNNQLISSQKGQIKTATGSNLYYIDSANPKNDISLIFSCPNAKPFTNDWKLSIYNEAKVLLSSQLINGSSCRTDSDTGVYKFTLSSGSSRYYLSVAPACASADNTTCQLDTSEYTISRDVAAKQTKLDTSLLKTAIALGTDKTGQINAMTDNDVYVVESTDAPEIPLIFSCTPMAVRKTNDWQLNIYDDSNELVSSQVINGSDCGSGFKADKGGYQFKLSSNDSTLYYLSVKSTCTTTNCVVDTSNYNIARDVTKTYTGVLATAKTVTTKTANFKLTKCGSSANATIAVKAENVNLSKKLTPINIQMGGVSCQTAAPIVANSLLGTIVDPSTLFDSSLIAKDSVSVILSDCGAAKSKVTLTGTELDLENLNPENAPNSVSIPVKVDFGDFHCSGKDVFYITSNDTGDTTYVNSSPKTDTTPITTPVTTTPVVTPTPVKTPDSFDTNWLASKKNLGAGQNGQIKSLTDINIYQVDTGTADANLTFGCPNSVRYQNDWKLLIYDNTQTLQSTTLINGSVCGTGKDGDTGTYPILLSKSSPSYYLVVESVCSVGDSTCVVDSSPYSIIRVTAAQAAATATAKTSCLIGTCTTSNVKPFFK